MDNVIKSEVLYQEHTGELIHKQTQPTENIILNRNAELRKNPGVIQDLGAQSGGTFGRQLAEIPMVMYAEAIRNGYELNSGDAEHRRMEMFRFLQSEKGKMCLVQGD